MILKSVGCAFLLTLSCCDEVQANLRGQENNELSAHRQLVQFEPLAGYQPKSLITDEAAIDLDQQTLEGIVSTKSFRRALPIYIQGGHSDSYAKLQIRSRGSVMIEEGQQVLANNAEGAQVLGIVRNSVTTPLSSISGAGKGSILLVGYEVNSVQDNYVGCQVGALVKLGMAETSGCFNATGHLTFAGQTTPFATYSYDVNTSNLNGRTLQSFSTNAEALMWNCSGGCPYDDFRKFVTYYGKPNYGDEFIMSAFNGSDTKFQNGNAYFALNYTRGGRGEAITGGALLMNIWMMVVREMEAAIDSCDNSDSCTTCIFDSINHWDSAVAFYAGSDQGKDGSGSGHLLYQRANDLCQNFRTCGGSGNDVKGVAGVNAAIFNEFGRGQQALSQRQCDNARSSKENIVKLMTVPLIQGTLLNAYILEQQSVFFDVEKAALQGATYAAAVLPIVHNCSKDDADIIYNYMGIGERKNVSYVDVKRAFENTYACMGIGCGQVGGYWLQVGEYGVNAAPCGDDSLSQKKKLGIGLGTVAAFLFILLCIALYIKFGRKTKSLESDAEHNNIVMSTEFRDEPTPPALT